MPRQISPDRTQPAFPSSLDGLVDAMLAYYLEWRLHAGAVAHAYRQWSNASRAERASRFSAYIGALDQEEATATRYAQGIKEVDRRLQEN